MTIREHIEAIDAASDDLEAVCEDCQYGHASVLGKVGLDKAISAAIAAADEREREFERAREAWNTFQSECNCEDDMETVCRHHDIWNRAEAILDAYFNPAKEGRHGRQERNGIPG